MWVELAGVEGLNHNEKNAKYRTPKTIKEDPKQYFPCREGKKDSKGPTL